MAYKIGDRVVLGKERNSETGKLVQLLGTVTETERDQFGEIGIKLVRLDSGAGWYRPATVQAV